MLLFALALRHNIFAPRAFLHNSFVPLACNITAPSAAADPCDRERTNEDIRTNITAPSEAADPCDRDMTNEDIRTNITAPSEAADLCDREMTNEDIRTRLCVLAWPLMNR